MKTIYQLFLQSSGISTDSRKIISNCMFFALKGENFNGNHFALKALEQGAFCAIVDEIIIEKDTKEVYDIFLKDGRIILVDNTLQTLQQLAHYHRSQLKNTKILAVGGSNGKTTTKELIFRVLNTQFRTFATQGNLNNHIGVPLTLLQIPQDCEIAVVEMGANHTKEIAELCEIASPDLGVITNVGFDHLEGFGSIEGVAKANGELFDFLKHKKNTIAFRNTYEIFLEEMTKGMPEIITYPNKNDNFCIIQKENTFFVEYTRFQNTQVSQDTTNKNDNFYTKTQLFGKHNFYNIATALCIGHHFGIPDEKADEAIKSYVPQNNRSQILEKNTNTIILDAYNANPSSMQSALEAFADMEIENEKIGNEKIGNEKIKTKKVIILGEMLEMGEHSPQMHENLGNFVKNLEFDEVVLYGNDMKYALPYLPKAYYFTDKFSLHNWLSDKKYTNSYFLIKGSRGAKLETTLAFLAP